MFELLVVFGYMVFGLVKVLTLATFVFCLLCFLWVVFLRTWLIACVFDLWLLCVPVADVS